MNEEVGITFDEAVKGLSIMTSGVTAEEFTDYLKKYHYEICLALMNYYIEYKKGGIR